MADMVAKKMSANQSTTDVLALAHADAWVFDLDNTLYPAACNLFAQVDVRIRDFVARFLDLPPAEAYALQKHYFREHGTTMHGMMRDHGMDPEPFLAYVHDIDLSMVPESPRLDTALARLPGRKIVFTNGSAGHAERVLAKLGIARHFEAVFDIVAAEYVPKPQPDAYAALARRLELAPTATVMVEDLARNLVPASAMGMTTVWVRCRPDDPLDDAAAPHVHHVVDDLETWLEDVASAMGSG